MQHSVRNYCTIRERKGSISSLELVSRERSQGVKLLHVPSKRQQEAGSRLWVILKSPLCSKIFLQAQIKYFIKPYLNLVLNQT